MQAMLTSCVFFAVVLASLAATAMCELAEGGTMFPAQQVVVKGLDLKKYSGRWYEMAKYPSKREPANEENTRANYTLRADGKFDILSETFVDKMKVRANGFAYKADPKSDEAKFKVSITSIFMDVRDYWVLYVDEYYHYAIVGNPTRTCLYILSRSNKIDDFVYKQLVRKAVNQGYNADQLVKIHHTDPPPS